MLNVHTYGPVDGMPVLALHGVEAHGARWRRIAAELPEWWLLGVDLRGHGRSTWAPPWHIDVHVEDLLVVLDRAGLDQVDVLAHSFGGAIALHLARRAPHRVRRLMLLDPALGLDAAVALEQAEQALREDYYGSAEAAGADLAEQWADLPLDVVREEVAEHLLCLEPHWYTWRHCAGAAVVAWSEMARPAVLPPPGVPTLIVPAARAEFVRPAWLAACRAELGELLTVVEVDAGHSLHLERTVEVAAVLRSFSRVTAELP